MKKRKVANLIMVILILVIAAAGVLTAGFIRGWFDHDAQAATLREIRGVVTMQRGGVAYPVDSDTVLRKGDTIVTSSRGTASIQIGESLISLNEKTELKVQESASAACALGMSAGEAFCLATSANPITLTLGEDQPLHLQDTAAFASVRSGARRLSVYAGQVSWGEQTAAAGQMLSWAGDTLSIEAASLQALNEFAISCMRRANEVVELCYSKEDLDRLEADRAAAMQEQLQQQLKVTEPETRPTEPTALTAPTAPTEPTMTEGETQPIGTDAPDLSPAASNPQPTQPPATQPPETKSPETEPPATETEATEPPPPETEPPLSCSIAIYCNTILDNWDNLDGDKAGYVPSDGVLLYPVTVEFEDGETVFDVLCRACSSAGIQLEYSWTPMYNSYYVEGIGNLYEFDCGSESGWMYKVNGWFPNYGCSSYTLSDGDVIVWCYTCNGLGADVGGGMG